MNEKIPPTKQMKKTLIIEGNHDNFTRIFSVRFIVMLFWIIIIKLRIYEKRIFSNARTQLRAKKEKRRES